MRRRDFLAAVGVGATSLCVCRLTEAAANEAAANETAKNAAAKLAKKLPRWRGFNLLEKFNAGNNRAFVEDDFKWMADWGFDFVRLPMDYRCWTEPNDPYKYREKVLAEIDQAVQFGQKYKIHVSLNLHRAPGYTVAQPPEKMNLWTDEEAQRQFDAQWANFARRYKGIPPAQLSFDLVNEPARVKGPDYAKVAKRAAEAIRKVDPNRLIISDGLDWGRTPIFELVDAGMAQSTRGYEPFRLTHYGASWVGGEKWAKPESWPLREGNQLRDRQWLYNDRIVPWKKLEAAGVGVHVGEWGAYNRTPHQVVLGWMKDMLELWKEAGWGWALWNFRGAFGILDSGRSDVEYVEFHGRKLDQQMLDLLRKY